MSMLSAPLCAFLAERRFGVLATIAPDGMPQQTVMWYDLCGDDILMNTARGRIKEQHLMRDQRASLCVEDEYRYVTLAGRVTLDDDPARAQADIAALARRYERERAERMIERFRRQQRVSIRFAIESVVSSGVER